MRSRFLRTPGQQTRKHGAATAAEGRGRFIVFEGIDGSGKSTTARRVAAHLQAEGVDVFLGQEPTDTAAGRAVRAAVEEQADPVSTTLLFVADRIQHCAVLEEHLARGRTVVLDRFLHSTLAYQSATLGDRMRDPMGWLRGLHEHVPLRPDRVVLLDLPAETAVARATERGSTDPFEKVGFLERVRSTYLMLAKAEPDLFEVVDASAPEETVFQAALAAVAPSVSP